VNLTAGAQRFARRNLTLEDALPTQMPVYVNSVWYLFGATALMALVLLIVTGIVMSIFGPTWYHSSGAGHYVNSMHFWSTQLFFLGLVLHLVVKFFMAAWRDKRWSTWVWGLLSMVVAIFAGLTGFLLQTSWDSQWIAVQAKDAMNAVGIGGFFNTLDTGQMLTVHVAVVPAVAVLFIGIHLYLVRRDSPVKPIAGKTGKAGAAAPAGNAGAPPAASEKAGQL
jgi:quinol-cytochrome oxidoreductase complex cytochrome b subunit